MERTTEPELMDDPAQADAYASADFSAPDEAFVQAFRERFGDDFAGEILDLGCGPGNIALRLAEALPRCRVLGVDGSAAMLAHARARAPRSRVAFRQAALPDPALPASHFAAVVSNSLLHHLHDPGVLWRAIRLAAAPGAAVLVGDLRRPGSPAAVRDLVEQHAGDAPDVLKRDFSASLHAAFTAPEVAAQLRDAGLDELAVEAVGDRHLRVWGRLRG